MMLRLFTPLAKGSIDPPRDSAAEIDSSEAIAPPIAKRRRRRKLRAPRWGQLLEEMFRAEQVKEATAGSIRLVVYRFEGMGLTWFDEPSLEAYRLRRVAAGKHRATIASELSRIRTFATWLSENGHDGGQVDEAPPPLPPAEPLPATPDRDEPAPADRHDPQPASTWLGRILARKGGA